MQRLFIFEAFNKGLLYDYLTVDEIFEINNMLTYFHNNTDNIFANILEAFRKGRTDQQTALKQVDIEKQLLRNI